jgi:hypothetical protein
LCQVHAKGFQERLGRLGCLIKLHAGVAAHFQEDLKGDVEKDTSHSLEIVMAPSRRPVAAHGGVAVVPGNVVMPAHFERSGCPGQARGRTAAS